jgi:GH15 family glucan-1,4-alpha-glucosidase
LNKIGDYALIGDCHSAALVGRDGSIDWACFPRFDSCSVFARILDAERGGTFAILPSAVRSTSRAYIADTNVLVTTFECDGGEIQVTDCMPVEHFDSSRPAKVRGFNCILRKIECTAGEVEIGVHVAPRFEYGLFVPRFRLTSARTAEIVGGADALWVTATSDLSAADDEIVAKWSMGSGQSEWVEVAWSSSHEVRSPSDAPDRATMEQRLQTTIEFWQHWLHLCWYDGDHREMVHRSALVLKALTYAPSGAVIAAPTTSLPEQLGGIRNWDYRYTWIRDSTLTLTSLFVLGFRHEADDFKRWLERTGAGRPQDLQIMYGIGGERSLPERELSQLEGHRGSAPVRIGNGAVKQMQLDAYGQILEAGYLYAKAGGELTEDNWRFLSGLVDVVCDRWRDPDHGIWEMRDDPRHFIHSKLNCWIALDRAVKMATHLKIACESWIAERDGLREYITDCAAETGWFPQASDHPVLDAAVLLIPAAGFLPTTDALVTATINRIRADLEKDGFVYRYLAEDGLEGGEGAFLLCSFWLLDCLIHAGQLDEADELLHQLLSLANDVGLFAEEADPATGEALGNFPQAFTHMALVLSCAHMSAAKRGLVPFEGAHDYAELALDRLLASRPKGWGV